MTVHRLTILTLLALLCCAGTATAAQKPTIKIGWTAWSDAEVTTRLSQRILENKMGYDVNLTMVDIGLQYQGIANGNLDVMLMGWLPLTHKDYWERLSDRVVNLGVLYTRARLGWVVPSYIPEDEVASISDLKKSGMSRKFDRMIVGIDPGAGLMQASERAMEVYDLDDYDLVASSGAGMTAMLDRAMRREKWIVVTGWSPHWMFVKWDLRYLEDPKGALGNLERVHALARPGFYQDHPEVAELFIRMYFPLPDLEATMLEANRSTYEEAVDNYIARNPARIHYWITGEIAEPTPTDRQ